MKYSLLLQDEWGCLGDPSYKSDIIDQVGYSERVRLLLYSRPELENIPSIVIRFFVF
jgi:hypothetical protein